MTSSRSTDHPTRTTRDAANVAAAAVVCYALLWLVSTQDATIRAVSPFGDDPWDAFASYAAIFLPVVAGATWVRSLRHRGRVLPSATASRIRWGSGLAAAIVLVAAGVDVQAVVANGFGPGAGETAGLLTILVLGSVIVASVALAMTIRAARAATPSTAPATAFEPDIVDDLLELVSEVGRAVGLRGPIDGAASSLERFLDGSSLSPRRHRWLFGIVLAVLAAIAFDVWHAIREGPWASLTPALAFGALVAVGVLAVYLGTVIPLRLLRPPVR